ncbi:uncharacterized protein LOC106656141 [Trichogramma pretiosum]|uniref:uncharacterized protein LOC106656141 n=1 Tax=Trichogramma pretiosum TaxID=7493 RepID=UPI0006C93D0C|nr:uncharacterized protein LOC106656141 [Trichogramma pretiosum]
MTLGSDEIIPVPTDVTAEIKAQLDSIVAQVHAINLRCKKIEDLIADANKKNDDTRNELAATRAEVGQLKEYLLIQPSTELRVNGLPLSLPHDTTEALSNIFKSILKVLGADRCHQDVLRYKFCKGGPASAPQTDHDKPLKSAPSTTFSFVAIFTQNVSRAHVVKRKRIHGPLKLSEIAPDHAGPDVQVDLCENMTPYIYKLFRAAKARAKQQGWITVYQQDGQLYALKTRDSQPIGIFSEIDLASIV